MENSKMKTCKACGAEIAKSAKVCPHCGAKNKKHRLWGIFLVVLGIIIFISAISDSGSAKPAAPKESTSSSSVQEKEKLAEQKKLPL